MLCVYFFDPRHFRRTTKGFPKTGPMRARFLLESVLALKQRLRDLGSDLLIRIGKPEKELLALLPRGSHVLTQQEVTSEELGVDRRVRQALTGRAELEYCWGITVCHKDDLPFRQDLRDLPDTYTQYKNKLEPEFVCKVNEVPPTFDGTPRPERGMRVRPCLPDLPPGVLPLPEVDVALLQFEPSWTDLPFADDVEPPAHDSRAVLEFKGGEAEGLARLQRCMSNEGCISNYVCTRNEMIGPDTSSKLAPWLANGCLSPRKLFESLRQFESSVRASPSTYWFLFSLNARDFFRFQAAKHGDAIFKEGGIVHRVPSWRGGDHEFQLWAEGRTGYPLVDANMRELRATGWMSNRGRQNVASFLALDLGVDWRRGAEWFESLLVDYDVGSNWVNWVAAAGLNGGRLNRFNVVRQAKVYDSEGAYVRHWLPALRRVPADKVHEPWLLSDDERQEFGASAYPLPCPITFVQPATTAAKVSSGCGAGKSRGQGRGKGQGQGKGESYYVDVSNASKEPVKDRTYPGRRWTSGGKSAPNYDALFPEVGA